MSGGASLPPCPSLFCFFFFGLPSPSHPSPPPQRRSLALDLGADAELTRTAFSVANDAYRSEICLSFEPHLLAVASLIMAATMLNRDISAWVEQLDLHAEGSDPDLKVVPSDIPSPWPA